LLVEKRVAAVIAFARLAGWDKTWNIPSITKSFPIIENSVSNNNDNNRVKPRKSESQEKIT
jgi:bifunctional pyridoxal-dependent enzyme with beta-cystathionase and maltose regulon repressor activities